MTAAAAPPDDNWRDWQLLAAATVAFGLGFGITFATVPSFSAQYLHIPPQQLGWLESLREVPGLLTAGIIGLLASLAEPRIAVLALGLMALGFGATGTADGFWTLAACNIVGSIGLHTWLTVQPSLTLTLTRPGHHGYGLGMMARYQAVAVMLGLLFVRFIARPLGYPGTFAFAGVCAAAGIYFVSRIPASRGGGLQERLVFRTAYWRYYALMLLDGGRRQVVQIFAVLILVREFSVPIETVATLLLVNNGLTMAAAPLVGRWTDHFGERRVLTLYYALVAIVFFGYTRISEASAAWSIAPQWIFAVLFAIDNVLFTASVGIQTYIRHTAPREELSPSLAMGLTWNHIAAVSVPLAAGWVWARFGYERIFLCGIGLALTSLLMCLTLPHRREYDS